MKSPDRPKNILLFFLVCASLLSFARGYSQQVLDQIAAIVGDQAVLQSELEFQLQLYITQTGQEPKTQSELNQLRQSLLDQTINDRLMLVQAEKDTSLRVTPQEVEAALQEHLQRIRGQFDSEEAFIQELAKEGLTVRELSVKYKSTVRGQILKDKLIAKRLAKVSVSSKEVEDFFENYRDSLPQQKPALKLSHILLQVKPSQKTLDSLRAEAEKIQAQVTAGGDFALLAQKYSQDPTAAQGGELGFFGRGELDSTFERVAFSLAPGEVSGVVKTVYGFHVIKVEERKTDQVRARHILILAQPSPSDQFERGLLADSLYQAAISGAEFPLLAQEFSEDPSSQKLGGSLGWVEIEQLEPVFQKALSGVKPGEISPPVISRYGIHLFAVEDQRDFRNLTLDEDWDSIRELARRYKTSKEIQDWVSDLRRRIYVEIKPAG